MLVDLDALECDKLLHPTINWSVGGKYTSHIDVVLDYKIIIGK